MQNELQGNHNVWYESYDPLFLEICWKSRVPKKWIAFENISKKYKKSIIKPINKYVEFLYPVPQPIAITNEKIILRQNTHADIYLKINDDGSFYNVDKPWIRQYYQSKYQKHCETCFDGVYKAYVPWIMDVDCNVSFIGVPDSPFMVRDMNTNFARIKKNLDAINPIMVPFSFSQIGPHMTDEGFGVIRSGTPIFDIVIDSDDIIEKQVRKFYANYQVSPIHRPNL